jgi:hypothetical protein
VAVYNGRHFIGNDVVVIAVLVEAMPFMLSEKVAELLEGARANADRFESCVPVAERRDAFGGIAALGNSRV